MVSVIHNLIAVPKDLTPRPSALTTEQKSLINIEEQSAPCQVPKLNASSQGPVVIGTATPITAAGIMIYMHPANERRCRNVTSSLIGWAQTQNCHNENGGEMEAS